MRARKQGAIVNIASLAGRNGFAGGTAYTASKHAVLGFARAATLEVRKDQVRVITICPGSVDTPLIRTQGMLTPDVQKILQPEDVADTVLAALALPAWAPGQRAGPPAHQPVRPPRPAEPAAWPGRPPCR